MQQMSEFWRVRVWDLGGWDRRRRSDVRLRSRICLQMELRQRLVDTPSPRTLEATEGDEKGSADQ